MGLLSDLYYEVAGSLNSARKRHANLRLKMELFVSNYPGKVVQYAIPESSSTQGVKEDTSGFIKFYVRHEFSSGVTSFRWFHSHDGGLQFIENEKRRFIEQPPLGYTVTKVVGPYPLPWGKDERFR